jgi:hypothetical protein
MPKLSGVVHGGQQAVSGATIQMYSVNTATVAGASTPMLTSAVTTDSSGSFTITGLYTCPVSNPFVYIVSTGGNPGLGGSVNNTDIVLMAALGTCNTLSSATFINIDELTTAPPQRTCRRSGRDFRRLRLSSISAQADSRHRLCSFRNSRLLPWRTY